MRKNKKRNVGLSFPNWLSYVWAVSTVCLCLSLTKNLALQYESASTFHGGNFSSFFADNISKGPWHRFATSAKSCLCVCVGDITSIGKGVFYVRLIFSRSTGIIKHAWQEIEMTHAMKKCRKSVGRLWAHFTCEICRESYHQRFLRDCNENHLRVFFSQGRYNVIN